MTSKIATQGDELEQEKHEDNNVNIASDNYVVLVNSSREAIDLIGAFDNHRKCNYRNFCSVDGINTLEHSPHLDLSLRRCQPSTTENQVINESHTLNHSNFSPFSR